MTKDEALRLALEALTVLLDEWTPARQAQLKGMDAITAIKAALEAKDEPIEFFDWYDNAHWGNEDFKEGCHRAWNAAIKYTTPPQRKPLTDDQITLIIADCASSHQHTDIHLARAIEQAHGITGENK
jgi:hypothetical protein